MQPIFPKSVTAKKFKGVEYEDGTEEYQEQETNLVEKQEIYIDVVNGVPVQKTRTTEEEEPVFDTVNVVDESGSPVMIPGRQKYNDKKQPVLDESGNPTFDPDTNLTHKVPKMITKTRPKMVRDELEDGLRLNPDQIIASLYGAVQYLIAKVEALESQ